MFEEKSKAKPLILVAMLVTWTVGTMIYTILGRMPKKFTAVVLSLVLLSGVGAGYLFYLFKYPPPSIQKQLLEAQQYLPELGKI